MKEDSAIDGRIFGTVLRKIVNDFAAGANLMVPLKWVIILWSEKLVETSHTFTKNCREILCKILL